MRRHMGIVRLDSGGKGVLVASETGVAQRGASGERDQRRLVSTEPAAAHNAKCHAQAIWSHIHNQSSVFVTSNGNFHTPAYKAKLIDLGASRIERPRDAAPLV